MAAVRVLTAGDARAYSVIRLNALRTDPAAFGSSFASESSFTPDEWRTRVVPPGGAVFGIDGVDGLVATGAVVTDWVDNRDCVLVAMWTEPDHRGNGHGRSIVESAVEFARARGARRVRCSVTEGNDTAMTLYVSCGFVPTGITDTRESDGLCHSHLEIILGNGT